MPHLTIEATANLQPALALDALLDAAHQALLASGVFEGPDVKSRLVVLERHRAGPDGGGAAGAFVHATLELLSGRPMAVRERLAQALVDAMAAQLGPGGHCAVQVSCNVRDMDRACYAKAILT